MSLTAPPPALPAAAASASSLLPKLLELTVHLADSVRFPGSTLSGQIVLSLPSRRSLALLHGVEASAAEGASSVSAVANSPAHASAAAAATGEGSSLLPRAALPAAPSCAPLSRPFGVALKVQLVGKALVDGAKVAAHAVARCHPVPGAAGGRGSSFKIWSTRIVTLTAPLDDAGEDTPPWESRRWEFRAALPDSLPPSFRGQALSHVYYMHIVAFPLLSGSAVGAKKVLELKLPLRVRVASTMGSRTAETPAGMLSNMHCWMTAPLGAPSTTTTNAAASASVAESNGSTVSASPLSSMASASASPDTTTALLQPTQDKQQQRAVPSPLSMPSASDAAASRSRRNSLSSPMSAAAESAPSAPLTFNISKDFLHKSDSANVVKLTLDQRYLRPGDTVRGHLDFSAAAVRCYRVSITLEQEESVSEDAASSPAHPFSHRRCVASFHAYTVNTLSTHFLFSLPLDAVANFSTDLFSVRWVLQFKFITDVEASPKSGWSFLPAPSSTKAEALCWTLPLTVMPHDDQEAVKQKAIKTVLLGPTAYV